MKWLSNLFGKGDGGASGKPRIQSVNPKTLLFSIPTLADDLPALGPIDKPPSRSDVVLGEDDWAQLEFFPRAARAVVVQRAAVADDCRQRSRDRALSRHRLGQSKALDGEVGLTIDDLHVFESGRCIADVR